MPKKPTLFVLNPLEEEIPEWVDGRLTCKAIINGLVVLVRFEPELVRVRKEQQAEEQEEDDKSERGLGHDSYLSLRARTERGRGNLVLGSWFEIPSPHGIASLRSQ